MKGHRSKPKKISEIISNIKNSEALKLSFELVPIWNQWKQIVGEEFSSLSEPSGYRRGKLHIKVKNTTVMHRLTFEKEQILRKIKEILPKDVVKDLFFELDEKE
ncbi:MAG: DUF721 domain-containing protein [Candidatus Hydrogenedens sp.]